MMGLVMSAIYLSYCIFNKTKIDHDVKDILQKHGVERTVRRMGKNGKRGEGSAEQFCGVEHAPSHVAASRRD